VKHFKRKNDLKFRIVDEVFLEKYKNFCAIDLGQKTRTITNKVVFIRSLFNKAIKNGVVDAICYHFGDGKEQIKFGQTHKIGLTKEEVKKIESLVLRKTHPFGIQKTFDSLHSILQKLEFLMH